MNRVKPPLGIMPKYLWDERRIFDLGEAIHRFANKYQPIPIEWVNEYNNLLKDEKDRINSLRPVER